VEVDAEKVRVEAIGKEGPIALAASASYRRVEEMVPKPERFLLGLDGKDLGREILARIEPIKSFQKTWSEIQPVAVRPGGVRFEAEAGAVMPEMSVGQDASASGGKYVWLPGEPGEKGGGAGAGSVIWRLRVERAGSYYLYGRVLTPTPDDDSFLIRAASSQMEVLGMTTWHTGVHKQWRWTPVRLGSPPARVAVLLPAGVVDLELHSRENGAKIDALFVTDKPDGLPRD
jgi:hypothetical protein